MSEQFDPYLKWLGIKPKDQPPHHYRLLGVDLYEDDPDIIENAADQRMAHVRTFAVGKHGQQSQQLLNKISAAKLVLLSPEKKAAYDAAVKTKLASRSPVAQRLPVAEPLSAAPAPPQPALATNSADDRQGKPPWQNPLVIGAVAVTLLLAIGIIVVASSGDSDLEEVAVDTSDAPSSDVIPEPSHPESFDPKLKPESKPPPEEKPQLEPQPEPEPAVPKPEPEPSKPQPQPEPQPDPEPEPTPPPNPVEPVAASGRLPLPDTAASEHSLKQIQDLFEDEFAAAKSPSQESQLAKKLLGLAIKSVDNPVDRFVLLKETRRLATLAGDVETALGAADQLADVFEVEALTTKVETVVALAKTARFTPQKKLLAEKTLELVAEASAEDLYDTASELIGIALTAARPAKDRELTKQIVARRKEVEGLAKAFTKAKGALATLKNNPDDPDANTIAGRYWCLVKNDWKLGLPMLAKGSDPQLRELAKKDMSNSTETDEQVALGNGWWELASGLKGLESKSLKLRAADWYDLASTKLTGLSKRRIITRLKETQAGQLRWKFLGVRKLCTDGFPSVPLDHQQIPDELVGKCDGFQGSIQGPCKVDHRSIGPAIRGWFGKSFVWSLIQKR